MACSSILLSSLWLCVYRELQALYLAGDGLLSLWLDRLAPQLIGPGISLFISRWDWSEWVDYPISIL
jgi:hypothetical protein